MVNLSGTPFFDVINLRRRFMHEAPLKMPENHITRASMVVLEGSQNRKFEHPVLVQSVDHAR